MCASEKEPQIDAGKIESDKMKIDEFEKGIKDLLHDHHEAAPDVLGNIFEKRTPLYILKNKLLLNKYKLIAAAVVTGAVIWLWPFNSNQNVDNDVVETTETTQSQDYVVNEKSANTSISEDNAVESVVSTTTSKSTKSDEESAAIDYNAIDAGLDISEKTSISNRIKPQQQDNPRVAEVSDVSSNDAKSALPTNQNNQTSDVKDGEDSVVTSEVADNPPNTETNSVKPVPKLTDKQGNNQNELKEEIATIEEMESKESAPASSMDDNAGSSNDYELPVVKPSKLSVSLRTGPGLGGRTLEGDGEAQSTNKIVNRIESEKQVVSLATTARLHYQVSGNLEVYTGIDYFNRRERMTFDKDIPFSETTVRSKTVIKQHPVLGPQQVTVYDTSTTTGLRNKQASSLNKYTHVSLPLGVQLTLYANNKLGVYMSADGGLEVFTRSKGFIADDQWNTIELGKAYDRTSIGYTFGWGAGASYLLTNRLSAMAGIRGTYFLTPVSENRNVLQSDYGYGLLLGLKFGL